MLRRVINICWPKVISNERLHEKTEATEWSVIIRKRRLDWLGHMMRLDKEKPVRLALYESLQPVQRKGGRPCSTWTKIIEKDLSLVDIKLDLNKKTPDETIATLEGLAEDRRNWRNLVKDIIAVNR